jgi:hypothetical protein
MANLTREELLQYYHAIDDIPYGTAFEDEVKYYRKNIIQFARMITKGMIPFTYKQKLWLISIQRSIEQRKYRKLMLLTQRGGGKTFLYAIASVWLALHFDGYHISILGGSKVQSDKVGNYIRKFLEDSKRFATYIVSANTERIVIHPPWHEFKSKISYLFASEKSVRGPHPSALFLDETVEIKPYLLESAFGQLVSPEFGVYDHKLLVITSTAQMGPSIGRFQQLWNRSFTQLKTVYDATEPEDKTFDEFLQEHQCNNIRTIRWNAYECPWITDEEVGEWKMLYSPDRFRVEVLGEFGLAAGMIFDPTHLDFAFNVQTPPKLEPNQAKYPVGMGVDWGGYLGHPTVAVVTQIQPRKDNFGRWTNKIIVLHVDGSNDYSYSEWIERLVYIARDYRPQMIYCDNSHKGEIERLSRGTLDIGEGQRLKYNLRVEGVPFVSNKWEMIEKLQWLLSVKRLEVHPKFINVQTQMRQYHYVNEPDKPRKTTKIDDDYVDAIMLSAYSLKPYYKMVAPTSHVMLKGTGGIELQSAERSNRIMLKGR